MDQPGFQWSAEAPAGLADTERAVALLATRLPPSLRVLAELAYDLGAAWQPGGSALFAAVDPWRWEALHHNPVRLLLETSPTRLARLAEDREFRARADGVRDVLAEQRSRPFLEVNGVAATRPVAFFCAEFGVHGALPIYAGGLGILAGDILREASDRALPLVGIGLYYRLGYFHQRLDPSGWQHEHWAETDAELLPMALVTRPEGEAQTVSVRIRGRDVVFQIWRAAIGRTSLYLLDAHRPENSRVDRWITARLYESVREYRLAQYAALGIGGVRALRALGIEPALLHLNEGHAALAALELWREGITAGVPRDAALAAARERIVFTTHTPIAAGNESYAASEVLGVLGHLPRDLGIDAEGILRLGRVRPDDAGEGFGVTVLALRTSRHANGVSRRHGEVARGMWHPMWPDRPVERVPISHVTNGVHLPRWMADPMRGLLTRYLGTDFERRAADPETWRGVEAIPDEELWAVRDELRGALVAFVRDRSVTDRLARPDDPAYVEAAARAFDPGVLTVGFARRLTEYKRLHLLAHDLGRGLRLLSGPRPLQIVVAGKAHPGDEAAKQLLQRIFGIRRAPEVGARVVYLEEYDVLSAMRLVTGCDIWLNLPRPPLEASGTSGMKAALNGVLNASVLDGWWLEGFDGTNGWALPADPASDEGARDARDAALLYDLLEHEIAPLFYERDAAGIPRGFVRRIKASLRTLGPLVCGGRMLGDYAQNVYGKG